MSSHRSTPPPPKPRHHSVTPPAVPRDRRTDAAFAAGVVIALAVLAWVVITMQQLSHDLSTSNSARDALAHQVQQLGASPVAGPPGSRGKPGATVTGPSGPPGSPGEQGEPGAAASPEPGPTGPTGPAGSPGADSTVPGPEGSPGVAGAQGVPGPAGPAGQDGKDGTDGKDGSNGSPPAGWTYTDPAGQSYTCSPVDAFDPSSPRYTCAPDAATPPRRLPTEAACSGSGCSPPRPRTGACDATMPLSSFGRAGALSS